MESSLQALSDLFLSKYCLFVQCVLFSTYKSYVLSFFVQDAAQVSITEFKPRDGVCSLQLKLPSNKKPPPGFWNFLERYGFRYGDGVKRILLPREVRLLLPACFLLDRVTVFLYFLERYGFHYGDGVKTHFAS